MGNMTTNQYARFVVKRSAIALGAGAATQVLAYGAQGVLASGGIRPAGNAVLNAASGLLSGARMNSRFGGEGGIAAASVLSRTRRRPTGSYKITSLR
jgi:hypothetical protein